MKSRFVYNAGPQGAGSVNLGGASGQTEWVDAIPEQARNAWMVAVLDDLIDFSHRAGLTATADGLQVSRDLAANESIDGFRHMPVNAGRTP